MLRRSSIAVALLVAGCSRGPYKPADTLLKPGEKVRFAHDEVEFMHNDTAGSGTIRLDPGAILTVRHDPGEWILSAADLEKQAEGQPPEVAAEIRRIKPVRAKAGELFATNRMITVTIDEGPDAGNSGQIFRYALGPVKP